MSALCLAITAGEPAGIGPELCVQLVQHPQQHKLVVIADPQLLQQRAAQLNLPLTVHQLSGLDDNQTVAVQPPGHINVLPVSLAQPSQPGQLNAANAQYVLDSLQRAVEGCQQKFFQAMVTAPVHKGIINEAGIPFSGHTEFLQQKTASPQVVMMLATEGLRVALVTTHLPLQEVPGSITPDRLRTVIRILHADLQRHFGLQQPRILVCGLNPHAGESGHLGREELDIIEPTLEQLRAEGMQLTGPLPADTLFTEHHLREADAVLAMYHDQGLPVLKYKGFGQAVNITLGLPIIRTSVDHGTALDLAGTGKADAGSLHTALRYAEHMAQNAGSLYLLQLTARGGAS